MATKKQPDEPIDHVIRQVLPWRPEATLTECGLEMKDGLAVITRDQLVVRAKEYGRRRTELMTCLTCCDTAQRWGTWAGSPLGVIQRELNWNSKSKELFVRELRAIAALIAAHPEEFKDYVDGLEETLSLADARRARRRRRA